MEQERRHDQTTRGEIAEGPRISEGGEERGGRERAEPERRGEEGHVRRPAIPRGDGPEAIGHRHAPEEGEAEDRGEPFREAEPGLARALQEREKGRRPERRREGRGEADLPAQPGGAEVPEGAPGVRRTPEMEERGSEPRRPCEERHEEDDDGTAVGLLSRARPRGPQLDREQRPARPYGRLRQEREGGEGAFPHGSTSSRFATTPSSAERAADGCGVTRREGRVRRGSGRGKPAASP